MIQTAARTMVNPERWRQIEEIYNAACAREPGVRSRFLEEACGEDEELRHEVVSLLAQGNSTGGVIDRPAWEGAKSLLDPTVTRIAIGTQLGPYRIEGLLGAGGMGEVFRAVDTRLDRRVAVKISAKQFSGRFEREARAISALNHPHICTLYDVGPNYLVMELVEGTPLKGPLPRDQALQYAGQICEALEAAHRKGIVHRDLKPANILVTKQGIKVLDFGLAHMDSSAPEPTLTKAGEVMGTPAYMAPEQWEGKPADTRSDIYAFGCVLYEMLTGKRVGQGPLSGLEAQPAALQSVVRMCLEKDPDERWQSAGDIKRALALPVGPAIKERHDWGWWAAAIVLFGALGVWAVLHFRQPQAQERVLRLDITPPEGSRFQFGSGGGGMALSPDGKTEAYVALTNGKSAIWIRSLDGATTRPIAGTDGAYYPFWSPDNESIGFFASGKLWRVEVAGGAPRPVCDLIAIGTGGAWSSDGNILFGVVGSALYQVPTSGGTPAPLTHTDASLGEIVHCWPQILPGGRIVYFALSHIQENTAIYETSLSKPNERARLFTSETNAVYAPAGDGKDYLLWLRGGTLMAQELDASSARLRGEPHPVVDPVAKSVRMNWMDVTASTNGMLVYGAPASMQLIRLDRRGNVLGEVGEPGDYSVFRFSPDGRRVAASRGKAGGSDLWMIDVQRGLSSPFTLNTEINDNPVWSPDGRTIAFTFGGPWNLFFKDSSGAGGQQRLTQSDRPQYANDWSRDGRFLLYSQTDLGTQLDLWVLPVGTGGKPAPGAKPWPYLQSPFNEASGRFSPEPSPQWVAYESDESARWEIYLQAFPEPHGKIQISSAGGRQVRWGTGLNELFYVSPDNRLMEVSLKVGAGSVEPSTPHELFQLPASLTGLSNFEISPDGQQFLALKPVQASPPLTAIVNWPALLKK